MQARLIVATEALADGTLTRRDLTRSYTKVYRNVYARAGVELTALDHAHAAWLWSGRRATLVGHSASALLGSRWIPADAPVELARARRPAAQGITVRSGEIRDDEVCTINGITCTTPARTAYDLGRRLPLETAIIRIDALLNATNVPIRKSSQSRTVSGHAASGPCEVLWTLQTQGQSLRRRPAYGCC